MNQFLTKTWGILGVASTLLMLFCSEIGYYALANAAVVGAGFYTVHLASVRYNRWQQAKQTVKKMTRKQQKTLTSMDTAEVKNIRSLSKMMPYLCFGVLLLNGYTYYYNSSLGKNTAFLNLQLPGAVNIAFLIAGILLGVVYYYAWCLKMNSLMDLQ